MSRRMELERSTRELILATIGLAILLCLRFHEELAQLTKVNIAVPWSSLILILLSLGVIVVVLVFLRKTFFLMPLYRTRMGGSAKSLFDDKRGIVIVEEENGKYRACMAFNISAVKGDGLDFLEALNRADIPYLYIYAPSLMGEDGYSMIFLCSKPSRDVFECIEEVKMLANQVKVLAEASHVEIHLDLAHHREIGEIAKIWKLKEPSFFSGFKKTQGILKPRPKPRVAPNSFDEGICIGRVIAGEFAGSPLYLLKSEVQRHVAIFGATGTGKTTTAAALALKLVKRRVNVLVIDWHGEYGELALHAGGVLYIPGGEEYPIVLNPFELIKGRDVEESVELMVDFFSDLFGLSHAQMFMLKEAIHHAYESALARGSSPILADVLHEVGVMPIKSGWDHETKMALLRRLRKLAEGKAGRALNGASTVRVEELFSGFKVIDLSEISDLAARSIVAATVLKLAYDYFTMLGGSDQLRQVIIVEEASNIMPPRRREGGISVGERILMELRKYGVGVVVLAHSPASISSEILKNTCVKIIHSLKSTDDLRVLPSLVVAGEDLRQLAARLRPGEVIVVSPSYSSPVIAQIHGPQILEKSIQESSVGVNFSRKDLLASSLDQA